MGERVGAGRRTLGRQAAVGSGPCGVREGCVRWVCPALPSTQLTWKPECSRVVRLAVPPSRMLRLQRGRTTGSRGIYAGVLAGEFDMFDRSALLVHIQGAAAARQGWRAALELAGAASKMPAHPAVPSCAAHLRRYTWRRYESITLSALRIASRPAGSSWSSTQQYQAVHIEHAHMLREKQADARGSQGNSDGVVGSAPRVHQCIGSARS